MFSDNSDSSAQLLLCVSAAAVFGMAPDKSMKLLGRIQGCDVLILLDSGSSHTFVSAKLVAQLSEHVMVVLPTAMSIKVPNGANFVVSPTSNKHSGKFRGYSYVMI
jgi:hypothetical protein